MTKIILAGADATDIGPALTEAGGTVARVEPPVTSNAMQAAGLDEADLFVLTDTEEATSLPLVRDRRPDIEIVVYSTDSVPDFASHIADLIIDPAALPLPTVVEEVLGRLD